MKKLRFAALVCAPTLLVLATPVLASPAMAQNTPPPAGPTGPGPDAAPPAPAQPAGNLAETINADFPKYDKDKSGELSKAEFGVWITEARGASGGPAPDKKALGEAFMKADADQNKTVSATELTSFLS